MNLETINAKTILQIDGGGAILTALSLGLLLPLWPEWIGLDSETLRQLGFVALMFACYSLSCGFLIQKNSHRWLPPIILANLVYCVLTTLILTKNSASIQILGWIYFVGEILIILSLVYFEWKVYLRSKDSLSNS